MRRLVSMIFVLLLAGCAHAPPASSERSPLLLISVDGLRPTDVTPAQMPNLSRFADAGVRANEGMRPSYPSLTFPNHYTLVTGLRPDHHGIAHNEMRDAALERFSVSAGKGVGDGRWWGGTPVWISAERAGLRTATLYWPGSEAEIQGVRPNRWLPYAEDLSALQRSRLVAGWLREPAATRPAFATLYFHAVDEASHDFGPDSPQARAARREVDDAFAALLRELQGAPLHGRVNIVFVSDHGFATVPPRQFVSVEGMAAPDIAQAVSDGQVITFAPLPGKQKEAERALLGRHDHHECWRRQAMPARWRYGTHPRIPEIVCQMDEGWDALFPRKLPKREATTHDRGSHGYDPALPSMRATFIANGPAFRHGYRVPAFDNVDVYPLLMRLLQLPAAPNDGDPATLDAALAPGH